MYFEKLKDKCEYFRSLTDYRLLPNSYVLLMLDGRAFSKMIKNRYEKPFDENFIGFMNETAKYLCERIANAKIAYVQSDEISILLTDFDSPTMDSFFGYRITKLLSIAASMAGAKFNNLVAQYQLKNGIIKDISEQVLVEFDCKSWNVPDLNEATNWFLYRQIDCVRNSKQQAAQTYFSHNKLHGKTTDEQVELLLNEKNIDWNDYKDGMKYGRFVYKDDVEVDTDNGTTTRHKWFIHDAFPLTDRDNRKKFDKLIGKVSIQISAAEDKSE